MFLQIKQIIHNIIWLDCIYYCNLNHFHLAPISKGWINTYWIIYILNVSWCKLVFFNVRNRNSNQLKLRLSNCQDFASYQYILRNNLMLINIIYVTYRERITKTHTGYHGRIRVKLKKKENISSQFYTF